MRNEKKLPFPLLPSLKRKLRSLPIEVQNEIIQAQQDFFPDPDFFRLALQSPLSIRANDLAVMLLTASQNMLLGRADEPSLNPLKVAQVLAWLADTKPQDMNWVVQQGLSWLGIERKTRRKGRPPGRVKDQQYLQYFNGAMLLIEQDKLWEVKQKIRREAKQKIQQELAKNWRFKLERDLGEKGWRPETVEFLATARSERALAIKLVSSHFGTGYDTVDRAVRRCGK